MGFLGVYTALYDYVPAGEGELTINAGDILYVLEKSTEDDWWKAKKKASAEDEDEPVGLIPNNYIQEAEPSSKARALYDYTRQTDEELSFTEDAQLEVFDTSDPDWILVGFEGEYGFVPANYIELSEEEESKEPPAPSLPNRPRAAPVEEEPDVLESPVLPQSPESPAAAAPAAAIAGIMQQRRKPSAPAARTPPEFTPEASDEEPSTPTLPVRPVLQVASSQPAREREPTRHYSPRLPASPGVAASPPHNRASFSAMGVDNVDDHKASRAPGGFHMYNISEMVHVMGKKKKMPTTLGINIATGTILIAPEQARDGPEQTWTAEKMTHYSLEGKHVFMELVRPSKSIDFHAGAKDTATEIVSALGELAGAARAEGLREVIAAGSGSGQKRGQVLYDFVAQGEDEVDVDVGDEVVIIDDGKSEEWWMVRRVKNAKEGVVPSSYIEIIGTTQLQSSAGINAGRSTVEQNRLEEARLARDALKTAKREEVEVGPGMRLPARGSSLYARDNGNQSGQQKRRENGREGGQSRSSKSKPDPAKVRTWTDRSKSFSVEAQFLALKDGKINLHKMNGVKIAVPVVKMSVEDLEYVERMTGISLDEDKPLSDIKKQQKSRAAEREREPSNGAAAGASIQRPEYDWFQFFLSCDVAVGLCERYAQAFKRDSMDESVLSDIDATVLRNLGIREGDIIKIIRFLDKKYMRKDGKRNVSFGGEDEGEAGLFSGPGGTLKNNTRKGRPAPAVQTNDVVDAHAFSQNGAEKSSPQGVATPLATAPTPTVKDEKRGGFDDDAWDVKPSKQQATSSPSTQSIPAPAPVPQQPAITGSMQELSLLSTPLEPVKAQPTAQATPQPQAPPAITPSIFAGIGNQQTGIPQQQPSPSGPLFPANLARQRPAPPQMTANATLIPPLPPSRPLSAPQAASAYAPPPLQAQTTGYGAFQPQIAPPGQSLHDLNQQRLQQQQQQQQMQQQQFMQQQTGMMQQPTGFNQFNPGAPNNFQQFPMQTGNPQQPFIPNQTGTPFANPPAQPFQPQPLQAQPTGFQSAFPTGQQFPQPTGVNSYLPPAMQPQPTGMMNGASGYGQTFTPPPVPPMPQQQPSPLTPQQTGPAPPVRFGLNGTNSIAPQPTGRRANLSQATPQNPFGF
ncbi:cytoskeletal protein binding protein [Ciborinia camelliae]|nr:cytoskeletal protein binding protein [Ciborinia camelliae]